MNSPDSTPSDSTPSDPAGLFETLSDPGLNPASDLADSELKMMNRAEVVTLGGGAQADYPSLALDPEESGFWGWVERTAQRATIWLNPILVKEARQSLKSKQFLIAFFCLLTASCGWTVVGIVFNAPDVYYIPSGDTFLTGYFLILSVSMFFFVPLVAFRSLAAELDEGTYEMLAITRLSAWRIVSGKMNSALLQMVIYFSAIVPCLAFCYLLRGISLATIVLVVSLVFVIAMVLTSFGLMLSTVAKGRTLQTFLLVGLVAFIVFVEFVSCGFVFSVVITERWSGTFLGFAYPYAVAASFVVLFLAAAAARIAPVTENRSTRLRAIMFFQQVLWIVTMFYAMLVTGDWEWISVGMTCLGCFWLILGVFMCGESSDLSPRVRRGLPATYATRMLFTWWTPGPGTGFMFVVSTGVAGLLVMGIGGTLASQVSGISSFHTNPLAFAALMSGYLFGYLGLIRLTSLPLRKRFGPNFAGPIAMTVLWLFAGMVIPAIIQVASSGRVSNRYEIIHASNVFWTWDESFRSSGVARRSPGGRPAFGVADSCVESVSAFQRIWTASLGGTAPSPARSIRSHMIF